MIKAHKLAGPIPGTTFSIRKGYTIVCHLNCTTINRGQNVYSNIVRLEQGAKIIVIERTSSAFLLDNGRDIMHAPETMSMWSCLMDGRLVYISNLEQLSFALEQLNS